MTIHTVVSVQCDNCTCVLGKRRLAGWRADADPVARWLAEETQPILDAPARSWPTATALYAAFCRWCENEGYHKMSSTMFGLRLVGEGVVRQKACYAIEVLSTAERDAEYFADGWGYDVTYFDDERDALLAARRARWYVDARKILCPACWAQAIQAQQEEE